MQTTVTADISVFAVLAQQWNEEQVSACDQ